MYSFVFISTSGLTLGSNRRNEGPKSNRRVLRFFWCLTTISININLVYGVYFYLFHYINIILLMEETVSNIP